MLVLTRKPGEKIRIGDSITVTVVEVTPGKVKLGVAAPREVSVDRQEVAAAKAAGGTPATPPGRTRPAPARPGPRG